MNKKVKKTHEEKWVPSSEAINKIIPEEKSDKRKKEKKALRILNHFTYLEALVKSFYCERLYVDAVRRWRGWGLVYFFILATVIALPISGRAFFQASDYFQNVVAPMFRTLPTIVLKHGRIVEPKTVWHENAFNYQPFFVLDIHGKKEDYARRRIPFVLFADELRVQYQLKGMPTPMNSEITFSEDMNGQLDADTVEKILKHTLLRGVGLWFVEMSDMLWGMGIPLTLFLMLLGQFVSLFFSRSGLSFLQSTRLSCIALTPSALLLSVVFLLGQWSSLWAFFGLFLALCYYLFGLRACQMNRTL